mgnify:CR=1 FL=1
MNEPMMMIALSTAALVAVQFWLFRREMVFQQARRGAVPTRLAAQFTPESYATAVDYSVAKLSLGAVGILLNGILLLAWTVGGGMLFLDQLWLSVEFSDHGTDIAMVISVVTIQATLHRLLAAYRQFVVERRFGFGRMSVGLFLRDTCLQGLMTLLAAGVLVSACAVLLAEFGALRWVAVWAVWVVFSWAASWLYPVIVAPLFNRFSRLDDEELTGRIDALLIRAGCGPAKIQVMDGSRRTSHGNAHVVGIGGARRVVLLDTLLETLDKDEIVAVLAHEMGHIKHAHITKHQVFQAVSAFLWIVGVGQFLTSTTILGDGAALTTVWLAAPVFAILGRPLASYLIRTFEYQADAFVTEHDNPEALKTALLKLYARNASVEDSDPLFGFVYLSHPTLPQRLAGLAR